MRRWLTLGATLVALASFAPAGAAVEAGYHVSQVTLANVGHVGEEAEYEVSMFAGRYKSHASTWEEPYEESGICSISIARVISRHDPEVPGSASEVWLDEACGVADVEVTPVLEGMHIKGTLSSTLSYHYYDGNDFILETVGESEIVVDVTLTGTGTIRNGFSEQMISAWFCGLPGSADMRGGGPWLEPVYERSATVSGSIVSADARIGSVPVETLAAEMMEVTTATAGACVTAI